MNGSFRLKGTSGPVINRTVPLAGELLIGTDAACELRLEEPGVAPRHAEIALTDAGEVRIRNLDPAYRTQVNGEEIAEALLGQGDEIRIATCRWLLQAPGLKPGRVLTEAAVRRQRSAWPWLLPVALALAAWLAWQQGWLTI